MRLSSKLHHSWFVKLKKEFDSLYFEQLLIFLEKEMMDKKIYPDIKNIFEAFNQTNFNNVKIVIIGQDPYHGLNQAHGLSFSVQKGTKCPPSLKNIFNELKSDLAIESPKSGHLLDWAKQGVLLLNSILTVRANEPASHQNIGWEKFTNEAVRKLSIERENIVFILWGKYAQKKEELIDEKKHLVLKSAHPSPLSAHKGFFGSNHFSKSNNYLQSYGISPVKWSLT